MFGIQERAYHHLFFAPLLTEESCSWFAFGFLFLSEGFVPSSDPHWTWKSALALQKLHGIGAHVPEFHLEMVKPNGFDLITCEDLWHALFQNYLVKRLWIKCPLGPSFSQILLFFSEMLSPPTQQSHQYQHHVMWHCCLTHRPVMPHSLQFIIYHKCSSQDPRGKSHHPQKNLPLKDSMRILKRKSSMHSHEILSWMNDVWLHLLTTLGCFA